MTEKEMGDGLSSKVGSDATRAVHESWYRGPHCNWYPSKSVLREPGAIVDHVLAGWIPPQPIISKEDHVLTMGSCFAQHIRDDLVIRGYKVAGKQPDGQEVTRRFLDEQQAYVVICGPGLNNTDVMRQQFEWAYDPQYEVGPTWFAEDRALRLPREETRVATRDVFDRTTVFIFTLGLSEAWYLKSSGQCCWRAVPKSQFDDTIYGFKTLTTAENAANLLRIIQLIRRHNSSAPVVFTVSPVPLMATFRPVSCLSADSASKSKLRAAIDEVMLDNPVGVYYFPSFEIVRDVIGPSAYTEGNRHVTPSVIKLVMGVFVENYCG